MSWLSSIPNPFKSLQFSDDEQQQQQQQQQQEHESQQSPVSPGAGVKDDLSAIGETIGRQLRGVASFLAPSPRPEIADSDDDFHPSRTFAGIRSDLAEIGGSFKTSLSLLSTNKAVSEISKLASNLLQLNEENDGDQINNDGGGGDDDDDDEEVEGIGITEDVIEFAGQISNRPELWTDFPLSLNHEFVMSDTQSEHAAVIEQLVPSLADLRSKLSSDKHFWLIYFILLLPRLNEDDLELLSTPEIVEAREALLMMLQTKNNEEMDSENPQSESSSEMNNEFSGVEMEKIPSVKKVTIPEISNASKSIESKDYEQSDTNRIPPNEAVITDNSNVGVVNKDHENIHNWSEEDVNAGNSTAAPKRFQSDDDVSFSDLEDDDTDLSSRRLASGPTQPTNTSSPEGSNEWVRLNENVATGGTQLRAQSSSRDRDSEGDESNDWLTVDDFDP